MPDRPTGNSASAEGHGNMSMLFNYWRLVLRRRWLIVAIVLSAVVAAFVITMLMTPQYEATSTIQIARQEKNIVDVEGLEPTTNPADMEFYETQYSLLEARSLAERVSKTLQLASSPTFLETFGANSEGSFLGDESSRRPPAKEREQREEAVVDILLKNIAIKPTRGSALVDVSFTSPDPALSQRVANAWTQQFIASNLDRRFEATAYARNFLDQRLQQLRGRLEASERQLVQYATTQRIVTVQTDGSQTPGAPPPERPLVADDLASINTELNRAVADRIQAASKLDGLNHEVVASPTLAQLRQQRAVAGAEYASLMAKFSPEYPAAAAVASQVESLDRSIAREQALVSGSLQRDYQDALKREGALRARVEQLKGDTLDLKRRNIQYDILKRDADTNRQLYEALLQRYKEIGVAGGVGVNNVLIVDPAGLPESPSSPNLPLNIALGLLIGLIVAGATVFVLEQFDDAVKDLESARRVLPVPVLGAVPVLPDGDPGEALKDRKSALSEAYLSVQTSLRFATDHGVPRSIAVTSTKPSEGKSTTCHALAQSLVRTGKKVVLVDADMRSPSVHHIYGIANERGLSNFMAGEDNVPSLIHHMDENGVDVVTAGPQPPNAAELLTSGRLGLLITRLLDDYDHVLIDSPPVLGLADAPLIGSQVEAVVFTVESHGAKVGAVMAALSRLRAANANVIGAVLTKFEQRKAQYGYGFEYEYGYGGDRAVSKA
jgi:capsular exopolysaccharide synthesis family protein